MPEATIFCVDNSEATRNGDYSPTRMEAVKDAFNLLMQTKIDTNPENAVGFLLMGNKNIDVVETLTQDAGRLSAAMTRVNPSGGELSFSAGLQVGQLALKHRNKSTLGKQRLVVFVASPLKESERDLEKLGKRLKKHSVMVDVVSIGCDTNTPLLEKFIEAVNSKHQERDTCHLVTIDAGMIIADRVMTTAIFNPDGDGMPGMGDAGGMPGAEGGMAGLGFDPSSDPELAEAIRASLAGADPGAAGGGVPAAPAPVQVEAKPGVEVRLKPNGKGGMYWATIKEIAEDGAVTIEFKDSEFPAETLSKKDWDAKEKQFKDPAPPPAAPDAKKPRTEGEAKVGNEVRLQPPGKNGMYWAEITEVSDAEIGLKWKDPDVPACKMPRDEFDKKSKTWRDPEPAAEAAPATAPPPTTTAPAADGDTAMKDGDGEGEKELTEEEAIAMALKMSMDEEDEGAAPAEAGKTPSKAGDDAGGGGKEADGKELTEEEQMEMALQMSMQEEEDAAGK